VKYIVNFLTSRNETKEYTEYNTLAEAFAGGRQTIENNPPNTYYLVGISDENNWAYFTKDKQELQDIEALDVLLAERNKL